MIHATTGWLFISVDGGEWKEIGEATWTTEEQDEEEEAAYIPLPTGFEIECTLTWRDRWAFDAPPMGCVPGWN